MINADGDNGFRAALNDSDTNTAPEFFVRKFTANPYASRIAAAELILEDTSQHNIIIKATTAVINCHGTEDPGIFGSDGAFPGRTINVQNLGIVAEATGIIRYTKPQTGHLVSTATIASARPSVIFP